MIVFKKIGWKNFLSTGNAFTEVDLDSHKTTLITGANGAGKSTMLDALCFALFDKPFRNLSKTKLINSVNNKDCQVYVEFETGKNSYRVCRGMKPNLLEIYKNGVLQNQESAMKEDQKFLEDHILKMTYKAFTQIDILGSARFTPFMQLPAGDRRSVIEDLLDIQVFSTMNTLAKARKKEIEQVLYESKSDMSAKIAIYENTKRTIKSLEESSGLTDIVNEIKELDEQLEQLDKEHLNLMKRYQELEHLSNAQAQLNDMQGKIVRNKEKARHLLNQASQKKKEFRDYENNPVCNECGQELDPEKVDAAKKRLANDIVKMTEDARECEKTADAIQGEYNRLSDEYEEYKKFLEDKRSSDTKIDNVVNRIDKLQERQKKFQSPDNQIAKIKAEQAALKDEMHDLAGVIKDHETELDTVNVALTLLKDSGIKAMLIKQYLPVINKKVNEYLKEMDFFVRFELDENFDEKILSRHLDSFSYENFSEGEKMRIDLALLFTWRHIARMRNSVSSNLLILDEVMDSSLDQDGTDDFLNIVQKLAAESNILVISHKSTAMIDKFERHIRFEKKANFSEMVVM